MARNKFHTEDSSEDSFLDVVANVVGVLIILVMLVGAQASRGVLADKSDSPIAIADVESELPPAERPVEEPLPLRTPDELAGLHAQLQSETHVALEAEKTLRDEIVRVARLSEESDAYDRKRVELAMHRTILQEDIEQRRKQLGESGQREFDVQRKLLEAKLDLDQLKQQQMNLIPSDDLITEVESVPTPLARTVEGDSIHLRLDGGLISIVPLEELKAEFEASLEGFRRRLQTSGKAFETFGPLDGYRLKVTVVKKNAHESITGPQVGQVYRSRFGLHAEFIPLSPDQGENVEQALMPTGRLYRHLQERNRHRPAVVVWLSTDSFDEFRPLKRVLWEMGLAIAVRPLPPGAHIEASPEGTRAAAQ